jgi:uncharacterized protein YbjT (DUF2867 family)
MILVTGAAGKTGRAIIKSLVNKGINVKAFVFKDLYAKEIYKLGAREVVVGNLLNLVDLKIALRDVNAVYHIGPNMHPEEITIGDIVIKAVQSSDCRRIVYHSVLHPQTAAMPHHWNKLKVEESLFESGLDYTILQPSAYMQNILKDLRFFRDFARKKRLLRSSCYYNLCLLNFHSCLAGIEWRSCYASSGYI